MTVPCFKEVCFRETVKEKKKKSSHDWFMTKVIGALQVNLQAILAHYLEMNPPQMASALTSIKKKN